MKWSSSSVLIVVKKVPRRETLNILNILAIRRRRRSLKALEDDATTELQVIQATQAAQGDGRMEVVVVMRVVVGLGLMAGLGHEAVMVVVVVVVVYKFRSTRRAPFAYFPSPQSMKRSSGIDEQMSGMNHPVPYARVIR